MSLVLSEPRTEALPSYLPRVPSGFVRPQWLIDANVKRYTDPHGTRWHLVAADHEATIRALADRVNIAEGNNLKPARGCRLATFIMGDIDVTCEYEYEPASGDGWNEPREEASFAILRAYLNGRWNDAEDVIPGPVLERWTVQLYEGETE